MDAGGRRERAPSNELHKRHLSSPLPQQPPPLPPPPPPQHHGAAAPSLAAPPSPAPSSDELALLRAHHASDRDFGLFSVYIMGSADMLELPGLPGTLVSLRFAAVSALFVTGTLFYRWAERLSWVDAAYCTAGVITTVGQVIVPRTTLGRCFTAVFNLLSLGLGVLLIMEIADARRDSARRLLRRTVRSTLSPAALEVAALVAATVPTVLAAALIIMFLEGWSSYGEAVYFCIICATGLGMGDVEPKRPITRLLFIAYVFQMMGLMLTATGTIGNALHEALRVRVVGDRQHAHHALKSPQHSDSSGASSSGHQ